MENILPWTEQEGFVHTGVIFDVLQAAGALDPPGGRSEVWPHLVQVVMDSGSFSTRKESTFGSGGSLRSEKQ